MMFNKKILTAVALMAFAGVSFGQVTGRSFTYSAADFVDQDYSGVGNMSVNVKTKVTVNPYLYITGFFGAEWVVDGWGSGVDTKTESIRFYHNETLTLDLEDFANPQKISGTATGEQEVDLQAELAFYNDSTSSQLYTSGLVNAADLNNAFNPAGPSFEVAFTAGLMRLDFTRKISISPSVGPGVYENVGLIKVIRN